MSTRRKKGSKIKFKVKAGYELCSGIKTNLCKSCYDNPDNRECSTIQTWKNSKDCKIIKGESNIR